MRALKNGDLSYLLELKRGFANPVIFPGEAIPHCFVENYYVSISMHVIYGFFKTLKNPIN
jgi:hypothetical protein